MSTETQNNTPVSAESVAHAGLLPCPFCGGSAHLSRACDLVNVRCDGWNPGECLGAGPNCYTEAEAVASWNRRAAPIAAQPDVTQQTLDDVMAGIPARDAEIEALRKEIETLRAQQDADKVDAERYRAWRDAAVANSTPFVRAMRDTLPPEAREGKPRWPTAAEWDAAIDAARKEQA